MKTQTKNLKKIAKKILSLSVIKKINSLKNEDELDEALKKAIVSQLKLKQHEIDLQISELNKQNKDSFYARVKASRIPAKIKHFQVEYNNEEFYKLQKLFNDIQKEVENARRIVR